MRNPAAEARVLGEDLQYVRGSRPSLSRHSTLGIVVGPAVLADEDVAL
jgi:hypothetical protein